MFIDLYIIDIPYIDLIIHHKKQQTILKFHMYEKWKDCINKQERNSLVAKFLNYKDSVH